MELLIPQLREVLYAIICLRRIDLSLHADMHSCVKKPDTKSLNSRDSSLIVSHRLRFQMLQ